MRHGVKIRKLGANSSHRLAILRALATALIKHKKIKTTVAKAKEARTFIEPLLTKAKEDTVQSRRHVSRFVYEPQAVKELFSVIAPAIKDRKGGYLRVVKTGQRAGDAAEMAILELVDFNEAIKEKEKEKVEAKALKKEQMKSKEAEAQEEVQD